MLSSAVISLYYYFGVVRAIYWSTNAPDLSPIAVSRLADPELAFGWCSGTLEIC